LVTITPCIAFSFETPACVGKQEKVTGKTYGIWRLHNTIAILIADIPALWDSF
jgi:hypothetical protein